MLFRGNQKAQFRIPATTLRGHQHTCHRESDGNCRCEVTNPNVNSVSRQRQLDWEGQLQKKDEQLAKTKSDSDLCQICLVNNDSDISVC